MDELVVPSLCTVEDADATCMSDDEEEQQPSYESAEEWDFTPSDMQSKDGDTSNDLHEKDEKTETDEQIVRKVLPPYYSYRNRIIHFKSLSTRSFLRASPFAFEAELQVNLKNETEMRKNINKILRVESIALICGQKKVSLYLVKFFQQSVSNQLQFFKLARFAQIYKILLCVVKLNTHNICQKPTRK